MRREKEHSQWPCVIAAQGRKALPRHREAFPILLEVTMLKKLMLSAAIGALSVSGAFAQANPPANPPATAAAPATSSPKFIAAQSPDQWVFSKFKGTDVLGPDNAHIGDVTDILFDKNGKVDALIV